MLPIHDLHYRDVVIILFFQTFILYKLLLSWSSKSTKTSDEFRKTPDCCTPTAQQAARSL